MVTDTNASGGKAIKFTAAASGVRSCPVYPLMPDDSCTGVPAGTSLAIISGGYSTQADGEVINAKLINGDLIVNHKNVTVTNSRIKGRIANNASNGLNISDSDIGLDSCPTSSSFFNNLNGTNYTLVRSKLHSSGADLMGIGGTGTIVIKDSIINGACFYPDDHLDALQFYAPGEVGKITVEHSIVDPRPTNTGGLGNAAIFWADNPGSGSRLTAFHSQFAGGNFTLSLYDGGAGSGVIFDVHDNTILKNTYQYGPCSTSNSIAFNGVEGYKFANNKFEDGTMVPGCN